MTQKPIWLFSIPSYTSPPRTRFSAYGRWLLPLSISLNSLLSYWGVFSTNFVLITLSGCSWKYAEGINPSQKLYHHFRVWKRVEFVTLRLCIKFRSSRIYGPGADYFSKVYIVTETTISIHTFPSGFLNYFVLLMQESNAACWRE